MPSKVAMDYIIKDGLDYLDSNKVHISVYM